MIPWHEVPGLMFLVILRLGLLVTRALTLSEMKGGQTEVRQLDLIMIPIQPSDPSRVSAFLGLAFRVTSCWLTLSEEKGPN